MNRDYEELYAVVGANIGRTRRIKGISQESLGRAVGLSRTSIINVEKGRQKILLATFCKLADALEVPPTLLLEQALSEADSKSISSLDESLKELKPSLRKMIKEKIES